MKSNKFVFSLMITGLSLMTGCNALQEELSANRNQAHILMRAEAAWHGAFACYRGVENSRDFHEGFRDGYVAVANGGDGCVPTIAPQKFWGCCEGGHDTKCGTRAWFTGYAHGAIAAEQDGIAGVNQLMLSPQFQEQSAIEESEHYYEDEQHIEALNPEPNLINPSIENHNNSVIVPGLNKDEMQYNGPFEKIPEPSIIEK